MYSKYGRNVKMKKTTEKSSMNKRSAWDNFVNTGSVQDYLAYLNTAPGSAISAEQNIFETSDTSDKHAPE